MRWQWDVGQRVAERGASCWGASPRDDGSPAIAGRVSGEEGSDTQVQFLPSQLLKLE